MKKFTIKRIIFENEGVIGRERQGKNRLSDKKDRMLYRTKLQC